VPYRLIPNSETAGTGGLIWNIGRVNEYGATDVLLDSKNRPLRYQLPVGTDSFNEASTRLRKEATDKARTFSAEQRRINEQLKFQAESGDEQAELLLMFQPKPAAGLK
jgi:hypothetical protein